MALTQLTQLTGQSGISTTIDYTMSDLVVDTISVGGTITYNDVTSVDSIGIITARKGIQVIADGINVTGVTTVGTALSLGDNIKAQFGNSGDIKLYHQSSDNHSYFTNSTGDLNIQGDVIRLKKADGGKTMAAFHQGGSQDFYYDTTRRLYTTTTGAALDYKLTIGGAAGSPGIISLVEGGAVSEIRVTRNSDANSDLQFKTERGDGTQVRAKIDYSGNFVVPAGKIGIGTITASPANLTVYGDGTTDNKPATIYQNALSGGGSSNGFYVGINHNDTIGYVWNYENQPLVFATNNTEKLRIDSSGRILAGTTSSSTNTRLMIQGRSDNAATTGTLHLQRGAANPGTNSGLGKIIFADNASAEGAYIWAQAAGQWASGDYPTYLTFATTADNASSPTERLRINSDGNIGAGIAPSSGARLWIATNDNPFVGTRYNAGADGSVLFLQHSRSNTIGAGAALNDNDEIGAVQFRAFASDNSSIKAAALIKAEVNGTTGSGGVPTDLIFGTGTSSSNASEKLRINSSGDMGLGASNPGADPAIGNDATVFEIRQTTTGNITSGNNRKGAVLRLKHEAQWENGYQSSSPNDDLGRVEFVTGDNSTGEGVRSVIRCRNLNYFNSQALTFEVATANSTSLEERLRITSGGNVKIGGHTSGSSTGGEDKLNIKGDGAQYIYIGSNDASSAGIYFDGDSNGDMAGSDYARITHNTDGYMQYDNWKSGTGHRFALEGNTRLEIKSDGNVYFSGDQTGNNRGIIYNHAGGFGIYASASSGVNRDIIFYSDAAGSSRKFTIRADGRFGFNTQAPYAYDTTATVFEVVGSVASAADIEVARFRGGQDANGGTAVLRLTNNNDRGLVLKGGRESDAEFAEIGTSSFNGTYNRAIRIDASGNMGLGTNAPNHYNNYSTITLNGATGGEIDFEDDGTLLGDHFCNVNGHYFTAGRSAAMPFIWQTHNGGSVGQRMQLTATGQLNIGGDLAQTGSQLQVTGDLLLQKNQAAYQHPQLELYATNTGAYGGAIKFTGHYNSKYQLALIKAYGGNGSPGSSGGSLGFSTGDGNEKLLIAADGDIDFRTTNEPAIIVDSGNANNGSGLKVEIDGSEQFRFDPSSIEYKKNNTRGTLLAPLDYYNNTNHYIDLTQWRASDNWNVLEVFGTVNPNSSGSGAYADPVHMYIYRGTGWDQANTAIAHWVYCASVAPPARHAFPSGTGYAGNAGISAVWYTGSAVRGNKSSTSTDYVRILIPNANGSNSFVKTFRVMRRY